MTEIGALVYHYCDLNAFLNIIKSKSLWMSDVKKSNDIAEGKYLALQMLGILTFNLEYKTSVSEKFSYDIVEEATQFIQKFLIKEDVRMYLPDGYTEETILRINEEIEEDIKQMNIENDSEEYELKDIKDIISSNSITLRNSKNVAESWPIDPGTEYYCDKFEEPIYTTCFSEDGDLLSQWRGYAADGTGIAIGFKKEYLNKWKIVESYDLRCDFAPIEYNERKIYEYAYSCCDEIMSLIKKKNAYKQLARKIYMFSEIDNSLKRIFSYSPYYKQSTFREEKEHRLVFVNGAKSSDGRIFYRKVDEFVNSEIEIFKLSQLKHRVSNNKICSYYELSFAPVADNIIGEIVIGPKSGVTTSDIEYLLSSCGYNVSGHSENAYDHRSIYIRHSLLTYR